MFKGIVEAKDLPENENIYLRKDMFGYRVVEPPTRWYHWVMGSKRNAAMLILLLLIATLFYFGINELTSECRKLADNPCNYCSSKQSSEYNLSIINITIVGNLSHGT